MPRKLDPKMAEKVMLKAGLKPLEPYKSCDSKWKCICQKCNEIVFPNYTNVKNGSGCIYCARKKVNIELIIKKMLDANLKPLEPYKNSQLKWKCRCLKCKKIVYPRFSSIQQGQGGCDYCRKVNMKGKRRLPEQKAIQIMRDASLEPLVPYVSTSTKWKSRCMKCQSVVYPRLHSLQRGKGGCRFCAAKKRHEHFKFPDSHAYQLAQKAKVVPLEPYVNMNTKWKCRCLICDKIVTPRLSDMKKGMGCKRCANLIANARLKLSDEKALAVMQKAKLQPLTPYENANKSWKCQCLVCGNLVSPSLNSIRDGGGCKYCATGGIKLQEPTYLYLITHIEFNSHKVGISNVKSEKKGSIDRLFRFNKLGWHTYKTWNFNSGNDALKVEKAIFKIIRDNLKIPIHLAKEQMPITLGHTETMDADLISLVELEKIINKVIKGHGK